MIERRQGKRVHISLPARIILDEEEYDGMIGNIAEDGVFYELTSLVESNREFSPHERIGVEVLIPHLGNMKLKCMIRWYIKPSNDRNSLLIGMQVIDPPEAYRGWVRKMIEKE